MTMYMYIYVDLVYIICVPCLSPSSCSCSIVPDIVVGAFEIGSRLEIGDWRLEIGSGSGSGSGDFLVRGKRGTTFEWMNG